MMIIVSIVTSSRKGTGKPFLRYIWAYRFSGYQLWTELDRLSPGHDQMGQVESVTNQRRTSHDQVRLPHRLSSI